MKDMFSRKESRSKLYGEQHSKSKSPTKRVKISEAQRISELREDIEGIDHNVQIKERRLRQSESSQNYSMCDRFYDEIQELKRARREKSRELMQLEVKEKRANRYRNSRSSNVSPSATPSAEQSCSITPTPTPSPVAAASPVNVSPVFLPKHTETGCTSFSGDSSGVSCCLISLSAFIVVPPQCTDAFGEVLK